MPLLLPALLLFGVFGAIVVDRERRAKAQGPGRIEGMPYTGAHAHEALLPMPDPSSPGRTLWVTPHHPLWCRAVGYHMRLCIKAAQQLAMVPKRPGFNFEGQNDGPGRFPRGLVPGFEAVQLAHARIDEAIASGRRPPPMQVVASFDGTPGMAARLYREGRLAGMAVQQ